MLKIELCEKVLNEALSKGGDFAEIFEEDKYHSSITNSNGKIDRINSGNSYGIGIRVYNGLNSIYATTNDNSQENLMKLASDLAASINKERKIEVKLQEIKYETKHPIIKSPRDFDLNYKLNFVNEAYDAAINYDDLIKKCVVTYLDEDQNVLIANSLGKYIEDHRVHVRLAIRPIAELDGKMQDGFYGPGAMMGLEFFDNLDIKEAAEKASSIAKTMLLADECPSGVMDVVINNGFGGVIFHEACGHPLEASAVSKNQSVFANKEGQQIASTLVSAVDDGTIPNAWGSSNIDDEGNFNQKRLLIKDGILNSYLVDQLNGKRMGLESNGAGRRQNYGYEPTSRMSNTYICNGESTFEEIIENTKFGLFAKNLGGGSVNPTTGDYNFAVIEGYLIEDGKITKPVRGASLVGNGAKTLLQIDMVGNNLKRAQGMCGAASGSIQTDVGQPTIRVKNMAVGGKGGAL